MAQANVYTTVTGLAWTTDKCRISTGSAAVTYQVDVVYPTATGNLYSAPVAVPADQRTDVFVGVGNKLTIVGSNYTAQEIGTASSGSQAVK